MATETISVTANGLEFFGWERVSVRQALGQAALSFEIATTEIIGVFESPFDRWHFPPFTEIELKAGGDLLCRGMVDSYIPSAGPENHDIVIQGRSTSGKLVDVAAYHATGQFGDQSVISILRSLANPYGVSVASFNADDVASAKVSIFQLRKGESVWSEALRLVGSYGATLAGAKDGSLLIARAGSTRHAGAISQMEMAGSIPIKEMSAVISGEHRYSNYSVIYQNSLGVEDINIFGEGTAKDPGVPFFKYKEWIAAGEIDQARANAMARWGASRAAGYSTRASVTVPGFRAVDGALWEPGYIEFVSSPFLKLDQDLVVAEATFSQDNETGTTTSLVLMDPRAFGGEASGLSGSGPEWAFPSFDE